MKSILFAAVAAFAIVTPAAAQPAAQQHGDHGSHQAAGQHDMHAGPGQAEPTQAAHADHAKSDCCDDKNGNGRMDCCEGAGAADRPCCADHAQPAAPAQQAQPQN